MCSSKARDTGTFPLYSGAITVRGSFTASYSQLVEVTQGGRVLALQVSSTPRPNSLSQLDLNIYRAQLVSPAEIFRLVVGIELADSRNSEGRNMRGILYACATEDGKVKVGW